MSLFADPDPLGYERAKAIGADRVELYTGPYGATYDDPAAAVHELDRLEKAANVGEVTSLAMILKYAGIRVGKMELADEVKKDPDDIKTGKAGDITHWGDPNEGFVGDITGKEKGYAIYAEPLEDLMKKYLPGRTVNLTGQSFEKILRYTIIMKGGDIIWNSHG
ncbi:pyridoxine 5'-phosphate synthase [Bacillus paralicheniformis]|uniref:pyridoxine 5'-phosphate synthase n=1 Tax=Bacillus paralicheniformis TaxID=1648923 RepID=UPI0030D9328F